MERDTTVLVTGATGSIGYVLAKRLAASGASVRAMARSPEKAAALKEIAGITIVSADLSRPESLRGCLDGCSLVVHCAAKLSGSDRAAFQAINVTGTQALIDEAVRAGVERFVHLSTIGVYGFAQAENITEEFLWPQSQHLYVTTKRQAERVVSEAAGKIPITIARLGDVVGPGQYTWTIGFIEKINRGLLHPPTDRASGILNLVYIDNLVDALLVIGSHPTAVGEIFNVVDGTPILTSEYIRRLARMTGKRPFAVPVFAIKGAAFLLMAGDLLRGREASVTPGDVDYLTHKATISGEKIRSRLGWKPAVDMEEGFRRTADWLRSEGYLPAGRAGQD